MDECANMTVPSSTGASSLSLTLGGPETPLPQPLSPPPKHRKIPPPPEGRLEFEKKPLPPVPYKRDSMASILSKEMTERFKTPTYGPDPFPRQSFSSNTELDNDETEIKVVLDNQTVSKRNPQRPRVDTRNLSRISRPDKALSPPPQSRSAEPKLQKLCGVAHIPTLRGTTPSGHNSDEKLYSHIGFGLNPAVAQQKKQLLAEQHGNLDDSGEVVDVSPLSPYGQADPKTAVSDLDGDAEGGDARASSSSGSSYFGQDPATQRNSAVPDPLGIVKPPSDGGGSGGLRFHDYTNARSRRHVDEYHEALVENARKRTEKEKQHLQPSATSSEDSVQKNIWSYQRTSSPHGRPLLRSPGSAQGLSPSVSTGKLRQGRWADAGRESSRMGSENTFGRLPNSFRTQHAATPSPSPDAGLRSKFEYDSDRATIGTPNTGRSVAISVASSGGARSAGETPDTSPSTNRTSVSPTANRHGRNSFLTKLLPHRDRAATSPATQERPYRYRHASPSISYPKSTATASPTRSLIPSRTPPRPTSSSASSTPKTQQQQPSPAPGGVAAAANRPAHGPRQHHHHHHQQQQQQHQQHQQQQRLRSKSSSLSSTLTTLTAGLVAKSSASISAMRMSGEERWRQRVKESIVVMPGGGQVHAAAAGEGREEEEEEEEEEGWGGVALRTNGGVVVVAGESVDQRKGREGGAVVKGNNKNGTRSGEVKGCGSNVGRSGPVMPPMSVPARGLGARARGTSPWPTPPAKNGGPSPRPSGEGFGE